MRYMYARTMSRIALMLAIATVFSSCAAMRSIREPKVTKPLYRATYLASSDGMTFKPALELLQQAQLAKAACRAIDRTKPLNAQYVVDRKERGGIEIKVTQCESSPQNCAKLVECLYSRPVAWIVRASGTEPQLAGPTYNDWVGRCGGRILMRLYLGPQSPYPNERASCVEPQHDELETSNELFLVARPNAENKPSITPTIESLVQRWDAVIFNPIDSL